MEYHITISGERIEYEAPSPELAAFLVRLTKAVNDPTTSEAEIINLVYGSENPLLDHTIFKGKGAVTRAVFDNPLYRVMTDLLDQKSALWRATGGASSPVQEAPSPLTVAEAAERLGISPSAVRQAIQAGRLTATKRKGRLFIERASIDGFQVSNRGPKPKANPRPQAGAEEGV